MSIPKFPRTLDGHPTDEIGPDVEGMGRGLARGGYLSGLAQFTEKAPGVRRRYGPAKRNAVNKIRASLEKPMNGVYGPDEHAFLASDIDAYGWQLIRSYVPPPTLYYPTPEGWAVRVCQWQHVTGGLPGNIAIDFCAPPGCPVVAVEKGTITRLSGHDPSEDVNDPYGVFGWSVRFTTAKGYSYFVTHLGRRLPTLAVGLVVEAGDTLGWVGDQHYRPDHTHYGVSSPLGVTDAHRRIQAVAAAPRIH